MTLLQVCCVFSLLFEVDCGLVYASYSHNSKPHICASFWYMWKICDKNLKVASYCHVSVLSICLWCCALRLTIHPTAKVSEQLNRKCPPKNTILQLSTPYTYPPPPPRTSTPKISMSGIAMLRRSGIGVGSLRSTKNLQYLRNGTR